MKADQENYQSIKMQKFCRNDELRHLTPGSAVPPTAASGGGAKPRNELEPFVRCHYHSGVSGGTQSKVALLAAC